MRLSRSLNFLLRSQVHEMRTLNREFEGHAIPQFTGMFNLKKNERIELNFLW
jgi:hypothetical protein